MKTIAVLITGLTFMAGLWIGALVVENRYAERVDNLNQAYDEALETGRAAVEKTRYCVHRLAACEVSREYPKP